MVTASGRAASSGGLFASLGVLGARVLGIVHTRVQLLALELEEECRHVFAMLVLALLAAICFALALSLLTTLMIVAFWDSHRLAVLLGLTLVYATAGVLTVLFAAWRMRVKSPAFATSLAEFGQDERQLGGAP